MERDSRRYRWVCGALVLIWATGAWAQISTPAGQPSAPAIHHRRQRAASDLSSLPLAVQSNISAILGRDDPNYVVQVQDGRAQVENSQQRFAAEFTSDGVEVRAGRERWRMALSGYGYGSALKAVEHVNPHIGFNRIEYRRGSMTEWYVNGPAGLEQGFAIKQAPARKVHGQPLTVALALSGDLEALADAGETSLTLRANKDGAAVLRYAGLTASDARGRELPSHLEIKNNRLLLKVDDHRARYPVVIDPWVELATLHASGSKSDDEVGWSVAMSGDTVIVGSPGSFSAKGLAYVFVKPKNGWKDMKQIARLSTSDGGDCRPGFCGFGYSVAVSGDTIMIGAPSASLNGTILVGAVYVFSRPTNGWKTTSKFNAKLVGSTTENAGFGGSVAMSNGTAVAGAAGEDAAYVFVRPKSGWKGLLSPAAQLTVLGGSRGDAFGFSVSVSGDTVVAGAPLANSSGIFGTNSYTGEAYVFVRPTNGWSNMTQTASLVASDGRDGDALGWSIAISGDTVVAGAYKAPHEGGAGPGVTYLFAKSAGGWKDMFQTAELTASDGSPGDAFGISVSISGNTILIGAPYAFVGSNSAQGAAYLFVEPKGGWTDMHETAKLAVSTGKANDNFGFSASIDGKEVVGGAPYASVTFARQGAAFVFGQE
jgi:trimeric autotransporter adhesin